MVSVRLRVWLPPLLACVIAAVPAMAATNIGVTSAVLPAARGTAPAAEPRVLRVGEDIVSSERIVTDEGGKTHLLFRDGSALTIGPRSDLVLDRFVYDADAKTGEIALSASRGILRLVGGRISKTTPIQVRTPTATIGIRGGIAIIELEDDEVTAQFLFGDELTMTSGGVTKTIKRPGFEMTSKGKNPPSDPKQTEKDKFDDKVSKLEGDPSQSKDTKDLVTDNDISKSQLAKLSSLLDPKLSGPNEPSGNSTPLSGLLGDKKTSDPAKDLQRVQSEDQADGTPGGGDPGDPGGGGDPGALPPTITGALAGQNVADNATLMPFAQVMLGDPDGPGIVTVTVSADNPAVGSFTAASIAAAGFTVNGDGSLSFTGTPAAAQAALMTLVFRPAENQVAPGQSLTTGFTITLDNGVVAVVDATSSLTALSINDNPMIAGAVAGQGVGDNMTLTPFAGLGIADVDVGQTVTVTVTQGGSGSGGITAASLAAAGFVDQGGGVHTFTGSPAAAQTAIRSLVFMPDENATAPGTVSTTSFTVAVTDGIGSVLDDLTTVLITSINDAPVLANVVNSAATVVTEAMPFSAVNIADVDFGAVVTVTVQIADPARGDFTAASLAAAGFAGSGGTYTFTGAPGDAQTAIRQLVFVSADGRVTTGTTEDVQFNVSVSDGDATTPGASIVTVSCQDVCRYDFTGRVKIGQDTNIGTDDNTAGSSRGLTFTSLITGNRFRATTAQGDYNLFVPTATGNFVLSGSNTTPDGSVTGSGFLAPNRDFILYELSGSQSLLFAGKPLTGFAFNDASFLGATYTLRNDFTLGGSDVPFIPQSLLGNMDAILTPTLDVLLGSGNPSPGMASRFFLSGTVGVDGVGSGQAIAASVLVGTSASDPSGSFFLGGEMRGLVDDGAVGFQQVRFESPVATADDATGNDVFGADNPRFMVLEAASVDSSDVVLSRGGTRFQGIAALPDPVFPNVPAMQTGVAFATFGPGTRTSRTLNGFAAGVSFERDSAGMPVAVDVFQNDSDFPVFYTDLELVTDPTSNRIEVTMRLEASTSFAAGDDASVIIAFGGLGDDNRSAFKNDTSFAAIEAAGAAVINDNSGTANGFFVTSDRVTFANGAIPIGVTLCACTHVQWGFFNATLVDPDIASYELGLAQWVAGEATTAAQLVGLTGLASYEGNVVASIAAGAADMPGAVSRYTAIGSFEMSVFLFPGGVDLNAGTMNLDNATYDLTPADASAPSATEFVFDINGTGPASGRTGSGSGAMFGPGNAGADIPPQNVAGQLQIFGGAEPVTYQAGGVFFGQNTGFDPGS